MRPPLAIGAAALTAVGLACGSQGSLGGSDQNGIQGGQATFQVTVDDSMFSPMILKAENVAHVTLTLTNTGSRPHDFVVECGNGACFPDAAAIGPLAPDAGAVTSFVAPFTEGIYPFHSDLPGDMQTGQFILQ
jgi:hypothetical protein